MALKDQIGCFAWFSLMTKDMGKATKFYQELMGWTTTDFEIPGHGTSTIYAASGQNFGNPVPMEGPEYGKIPSHWISYLAVADVDDWIKRAESMGGKTSVPAFDIPSVGRTAVVNDPLGTAFHVYTPENKEDDLAMTGSKPGQICWLELMVDEPSKVIPYYQEMLGWKISGPTAVTGGEYHNLEINGQKIGGIMKRPPEAPKMPPVWMPYMTVENVEQASKTATSLGGKVLMEKTEIPETGFFSLIEDPTGAHFYAFEYNADFLNN